MTSLVLEFSRTENCPLAARQDSTKFGADPRWGSDFPKNIL